MTKRRAATPDIIPCPGWTPAQVWAYGQGPRLMAPAHLCSAHGWSRYTVDADPSL